MHGTVCTVLHSETVVLEPSIKSCKLKGLVRLIYRLKVFFDQNLLFVTKTFFVLFSLYTLLW